jgi:hypothetical protein
MRFAILITAFAMLTGCFRSTSDGAKSRPLTAEEKRIVEVARKAVAANETWEKAKFDRPEKQPDGSWIVLVSRRPSMPGAHVYITIDASGNVTEYAGGK